MCWPYTYRKLVPRMSALKNANKKLQEQLTSDIQNPRTCSGLCIVHSEETFRIDLLESKYVQGAHADIELS